MGHVLEEVVTLGQSGRLVIPASFRKALGLEKGSALTLRLHDDRVELMSSEQAVACAREQLAPYLPAGRSLADELIAERRHESKKDGEL